MGEERGGTAPQLLQYYYCLRVLLLLFGLYTSRSIMALSREENAHRLHEVPRGFIDASTHSSGELPSRTRTTMGDFTPGTRCHGSGVQVYTHLEVVHILYQCSVRGRLLYLPMSTILVEHLRRGSGAVLTLRHGEATQQQ